MQIEYDLPLQVFHIPTLCQLTFVKDLLLFYHRSMKTVICTGQVNF